MSNYYRFPNNVQVTDISSHLTGNGAQALQYIARSTRLDGKNKGDRIKDLEKAKDFINFEIARILQQQQKPDFGKMADEVKKYRTSLR